MVAPVPATRLDDALGAPARTGLISQSSTQHRTRKVRPLAAARAAALALIPLRPGILDLRALGTTADICLLARRPAAVVLNQAPPRGPMPGQAAAVIAESNLDVVPHRVAHASRSCIP